MTVNDDILKELDSLKRQITELRHNLQIAEIKMCRLLYSFKCTDKEIAENVGLSEVFVRTWRDIEKLPQYKEHGQYLSKKDRDKKGAD